MRTFVLEMSSMVNGLARYSLLLTFQNMILMYEVIIPFLIPSACHFFAQACRCKNRPLCIFNFLQSVVSTPTSGTRNVRTFLSFVALLLHI